MPATQANYIIADTFADAPTASYKTNDVLFCKDTGKVYVHTGSAWTEQTAVNTLLATASHAHTHAATTGQTATDHHPAPVAGPDSDITMDVAGAAGTAATFARSAHGHQLVTGGSIGQPILSDSIGTQGTGGAVARAAHKHQGVGAIARIVGDVAIANTETLVVSYGSGIPTNVINNAGFTMRFRAVATITTGATPGSSIFRFRIGPTALTGAAIVSMTLPNGSSITAAPFVIAGEVTVRTTGATAGVLGSIWVDAQATAAPIAFTVSAATVTAPSATVAIDATLTTNKPSLTYISGNAGSTATFRQAIIEVVSMG